MGILRIFSQRQQMIRTFKTDYLILKLGILLVDRINFFSDLWQTHFKLCAFILLSEIRIESKACKGNA